MATYIPSHANLKYIHGTLQMTLNGYIGQDFSIIRIAMASTDHNAAPPPLLHSICPPQAVEPCSRTITESRCWLLSCVDLGDGYHFSHTRLCNLTPTQTSFAHPLLSHSAIFLIDSSALNTSMAHIRHQMHSRRGGCRGGGIRPPATPSLDSASPSPSPNIPNPYGSFSGWYLDTHSGQG